MGKIKSFASLQIRKITGGKDPVRLIEEFIIRRGLDPEECCKDRTRQDIRWMLPIGEGEELEVCLQGLDQPHETTIYMGINVASVPLKNSYNTLVAALEIADGLVGIKVSLVGHYLVLSSTFPASTVSGEDIDYNFEIITAQQTWFREALADELGIEQLPEE